MKFIILKNDVYFDEKNGTFYKITGQHFNDYAAEYTDDVNADGEPVDFKPCILTAADLRRITCAKKTDHIYIE